MTTRTAISSSILSAFFVFVALISAGCSSVQAYKPPPAPLSSLPDGETAAIIQVQPDGNVRLLDATGKTELPTCQLCDEAAQQRYGKNCAAAGAEAVRFCQGTIIATLHNLDPLVILSTQRNPFCTTIQRKGKFYQGPCYCAPNETPPPGIVCANR